MAIKIKDIAKIIAYEKLIEKLQEIEKGNIDIKDAIKILATSFRIILEKLKLKSKKSYAYYI